MSRPSNPRSVALDASAVIAALKGEKTGPIVDRVLDAARAGDVALYASTMLLVEARGQGNSPVFDHEQERETLEKLQQPHWIYVETDARVALRARELAITHGLAGEDAVHLAAAIEAEVEVFMTLDRKDFPMDQDVDGVWVSEPYPPQGSDLLVSDPYDDEP